MIGRAFYCIKGTEVMDMAGKPLKVIGKVLLKDGTVKPIEDLTSEELARVNKSMSDRLSRVMSDYFHNNPEAYKVFLKEC